MAVGLFHEWAYAAASIAPTLIRHWRGFSYHNYVCPSVHPYVTLPDCIHMVRPTIMISSQSGSPMILVFSARQHAERAICYRPSVRLSVCLSVCLSVRHTGGSVKNG